MGIASQGHLLTKFIDMQLLATLKEESERGQVFQWWERVQGSGYGDNNHVARMTADVM